MKNRPALLTLLAVCMMMWSCDDTTKKTEGCGNGLLDLGEQCDGVNLDGASCASLGYYNAAGVLACAADCRYEVSDCGGICGDGVVDGADGEACDGANLNGNSCQSLGYYGGTLTCGGDCGYDVSGCAGRCGNGIIDDGEVCDSAALADETCETQGFHGGALGCETDCSGYNLDACTAVGRCGDSVIQATYGEVCDGSNLDEETCDSQGHYPGTLACDPVTCQFDFAGCGGMCGDGTIQAAQEMCDGTNLGGATCVSEGYSARGGLLGCSFCLFEQNTCVPMSGNADLTSLTVTTGTLTPSFSSSTTSYSVTVPLAVSSLTVTGAAADAPYATVAMSPAQPMALIVGANPATVTVTAEDGTEKSYSVTVTRETTQDYTSPNIGTLIYVPAGTFQRDTTATNLSVVSAFRMSKYEITRAQWTTVTGWADPSDVTYSSGVNDPVQTVSWYDAIAFCNRLSLLEGLTPVYSVSGVNFSTLTYAQIPTASDATWNAVTANWAANGYRLPTEMEWMWAAMGADTANPGVTNTTGYTKAFAGSTGSNVIGDYAVFGNYYSETGRTTTPRTNPVGSKLANELWFHDLSGNVWEWGWDWSYYNYPSGTLTDYRGPASGTNRVMRGGDWINSATNCTMANRTNNTPNNRYGSIGFRVVRN